MSDPNLPQPPYESQPPYPPLPLGYAVPTTAPRPTSVIVLSIIGIILGGLRVLCAPLQAFSLVYLVRMGTGAAPTTAAATTVPAAAAPATLPAVTALTVSLPMSLLVWTVLLTVVGLLLGVALLTGSIGSIMLKPWARRLMIVYAIVAIAMTSSQLIYRFATAGLAMQPAGMAPSPVPWAVLASFVMTLVGLIYPIFVLVYYRKPDVIQAFETHHS